MKKKSLSLQKLPEISKQKKQKILEKNQQFNQKMRGIQKLELQNQMMNLKLKSFQSSRFIKKQTSLKAQERAFKMIEVVNKYQKLIELEPIKDSSYKTQRTLIQPSSIIKTPMKRMDVDKYFQDKNDLNIEEELKEIEVQNNRRQYLPSVVESQKKTFPYYSQKAKKYEDEPFIKLEENEEKVKIRFINGFQKWVNKNTLKEVSQYEPLTLDSFRKTKKWEEPAKIAQEKHSLATNSKINIDSLFLNKMLSEVFIKKNPRQQIKQILREQLYANYEDSVKSFNKILEEGRQIKTINRFQRKSKVSAQLKSKIDHLLICSYNLQFLEIYMLGKSTYISMMVESYNIIGKLQRFSHFSKLYLINNGALFQEQKSLVNEITSYFCDQKNKTENIIFQLQQHLNVLTRAIYKDIEHIIFLNPRLVGTNYQDYVKLFISSFSAHLSRIIRSVIIQALNRQLQEFVQFFIAYSNNSEKAVWYRDSPLTNFYEKMMITNNPMDIEQIHQKIIHGPGLIPIKLTLKKWKKKKYSNIYRFIIDSRKKIRSFNIQNWKSYIGTEERISYKDSSQLLDSIILFPLKRYLTDMDASENVNGCIYNKRIQLFEFINVDQFKQNMGKLYVKQYEEKVKMFVTYFQLWELYFMEKAYIDDFILVYQKSTAINFIQKELQYLNLDLKLIKSWPKIIQIQFIRMDISQIKDKIQSTINSFKEKILKSAEESLIKLLDYGHNQTSRAKKLNEVVSYTNLAEYIEFINFINKRQVQKSISTIAQNVIYVNKNINLLQNNNISIKYSMMSKYLQCGIWIKTIRTAANQNKKKLIVDPYSFLKGVKQKKTKIYQKYNKMLKQIVEIMKVNQIKNTSKLSVLTTNIAHQMQQICIIVDEIVKEEQLLQLQFAPAYEASVKSDKIYRSDLTFFYKQQKILKKYQQFWVYTSKLTRFIDNLGQKLIISIDGVYLVRLLRQGQQLISMVKSSTLNKRFLHLCDQISQHMEPYLKCIKLFLFVADGSQSYRLKILKQITDQPGFPDTKKQVYNLTVKDIMIWPLNLIQWLNIYRIRQDNQLYESLSSRLNNIFAIIKNIEVSTKQLKGAGYMRQFNILIINDQTIAIIQYCLQVTKIIEQRYAHIFKSPDLEQNFLLETIKKLSIFERTILKMKAVYDRIFRYYSLFELIYPYINTHFESFNMVYYYTAYENFIFDFSKKTELVKKLSFVALYQDKVRVNYDQDLKKLEQFEIKFYNDVLSVILETHNFSNKFSLEKYNIYKTFCSFGLQSFNQNACKLFGDWCIRASFKLQFYSSQYYLILRQVQTIHKEVIQINLKQKVIDVKKYMKNDVQQMEIRCGLLSIVQKTNSQFKKIIQEQTFSILKLVYEFHYNTQLIFQLYFYVSNLLFQPILNALTIHFSFDLAMLYENKYDLNILSSTLKEKKIFIPKEKQNYHYVDTINKLIKGFLHITNLLQQKQYALDDIQKGKIKKMYAYNMLPKILLQGYEEQENKQWLSNLKQQKQDDFIFNTHLNPALNRLGLLDLDSNRIQIRQVEKKQVINNFIQSKLDINHMMKQDQFKSSLPTDHLKAKIIVNLASHLGLKDYSVLFNYEIINNDIEPHYFVQSYQSTQFLIEGSQLNKVLITNIHPNYHLLGCNFIKGSRYLVGCNKHLAITVNSGKELLSVLREIISNKRHMSRNFTYIYYDKLQYKVIKSQNVQQYCIVYEFTPKLHVNALLKKPLNYHSNQIFSSLLQSEKMFQKCYPFIENSQKIIPQNLLKFQFDIKQKQLILSEIWNYQINQGYSPQISEQKLAVILQPILAITQARPIINYYYQLAEFIYSKTEKNLKIQKKKSIKQNLNLTQNSQNKGSLALYVLPIYKFTKEQLFSQIQYQEYQMKVIDKIKLTENIKKYQRPQIIRGFIQELILNISGKIPLGDRWEIFRLRGNTNARIKWFVIDLQHQMDVCEYVFNFFASSLSSNKYVLLNQINIGTDIHFNQINLKSQTHKIIFIIDPKLIKKYKKDLPPLPVFNISQKIDPLRQFKTSLNKVKQQFDPSFTSLINFDSLVQHFKRILQLINIEWTIDSTGFMNDIFFALINEVRKKEIASGNYIQQNLSNQESKTNLYGATDLRQKVKIAYEQQIQLQQIQKKMSQVRRQIYKNFNINSKTDYILKEQTHYILNRQLKILVPSLNNSLQIHEQLRQCLTFSLYNSIVLTHPQNKQELSNRLEPLTSTKHLYEYCFCIQTGKWQRWEQIDTHLTHQSCNSNIHSHILNSKQIIRYSKLKYKLQTLKDYAEDMQTIQNIQPQLINMKGPEIYISKLMILYQFPLKIQLSMNEYPNWVFNYQLDLLSKKSKEIQHPFRAIPDCSSKKVHKMLNQLQLPDKNVKLMAINQKFSEKDWKSTLQYNIHQNGSEWYKLANTSLIFLTKEDEPKVSLSCHSVKTTISSSTLSPYTLITIIHQQNRFNDIQSKLQNVILSLLTYENKISFLENHRFRQFIDKNISFQEYQQIFGLIMNISHPDYYQQFKKKVKDILNKIKLTEYQNKDNLDQQQIQKIKKFDKIEQINNCFTKFLTCVSINRQSISNNFTLRYMLKKPKKYERPIIESKKRVKSPIKIQFNDIVYLYDAFDRSSIIKNELSQIMLFFNIREKALVVEHNGSFTSQIKQKYIYAYKIYQWARATMLKNKNTKPFAIDQYECFQHQINYKQISLFSRQSLPLLCEQIQTNISQHKIVIVFVYNEFIFQEIVEIVHEKLILNSNINNHYYLLFTPKLVSPQHGLRSIQQSSSPQTHDYLTEIKQTKLQTLRQKIELFVSKRAKQQIDQSNIGTKYVPSTIEKLKQIKAYQSFNETQLTTKKNIVEKTEKQIALTEASIKQSLQTISTHEKTINRKQKQLYFWKLKDEFYTGNDEILEVSKVIRATNRKKMQKQLNKAQYLDDNTYNISYIYLFNILADNSYFVDKSLSLLDQQYELNKNYQIPEDQKKQFQKLINYGRLSALIENDELVFGDLIEDDQIFMSDKIRYQFVYLRHVRDIILEERVYSKNQLLTLKDILSKEMPMIVKYGQNDLTIAFNKYITYLFCHKYVKKKINKEITDISLKIQDLKESMVKLKEKIQHQSMKLTNINNNIRQIKTKYDANLRELKICKQNQQNFTRFANQNIAIIASVYLKNYIGMAIAFDYDLNNKIQNDKKRKQLIDEAKYQFTDNVNEIQKQPAATWMQEGKVKQISSTQVIREICQFIGEEMIKPKRRNLTAKECEFILSVLPRQTINLLINENHIQSLNRLYHQCLIELVKLLFPDQFRLFKISQYRDYSDVLSQLDHRRYNVLDVLQEQQSFKHVFCWQLQNNYTIQIKGLLDRLTNKKVIINERMIKFSQKIQLVQSKSAESIQRFLLQAEAITNIQQSIINSLKQMTNTTNQNLFYEGEWISKNQQKVVLYEDIIQKIYQCICQYYGKKVEQNIVKYYLRLTGMICRKSGLINYQTIINQLLYDHNSNKEYKIKQIKQIPFQLKFNKTGNEQSNLEQNKTNNDYVSTINTMNSILLAPCRLILVHANELTGKILARLASKTNKVIKMKELIEYYKEEIKSKEHWIIINVNPNQPLTQTIKQISALKCKIQWQNQINTKFILLFESSSWTQTDITQLQSSIQPVYRFFYQNSPTSIYYHADNLANKANGNAFPFAVTIDKIISYFCPQSPHVPYGHLKLNDLQPAQFYEIIQNLFDLFNLPPQRLEYKIFSICSQQLPITHEQINSKLTSNQLFNYIPLLIQQDYLQKIKINSGVQSPLQSTLINWLSRLKVSVEAQTITNVKKTNKIALHDLMRPKITNSQILKQGENILTNPLTYIIVHRAFQKMIKKTVTRRNLNTNIINIYESKQIKQQKNATNQLDAITNKQELFIEIERQCNNLTLQFSQALLQITRKQKKGSISISLKLSGCAQPWLNDIFEGELFVLVTSKRNKNPNQQNYVKGVFFKFSESIIYVKKETLPGDLGQDEGNNTMKPLPQFKSLVPVYTNKYEFLGTLQMVTNQLVQTKPILFIQLIS